MDKYYLYSTEPVPSVGKRGGITKPIIGTANCNFIYNANGWLGYEANFEDGVFSLAPLRKPFWLYQFCDGRGMDPSDYHGLLPITVEEVLEESRGHRHVTIHGATRIADRVAAQETALQELIQRMDDAGYEREPDRYRFCRVYPVKAGYSVDGVTIVGPGISIGFRRRDGQEIGETDKDVLRDAVHDLLVPNYLQTPYREPAIITVSGFLIGDDWRER